jgi:hypothetical protein
MFLKFRVFQLMVALLAVVLLAFLGAPDFVFAQDATADPAATVDAVTPAPEGPAPDMVYVPREFVSNQTYLNIIAYILIAVAGGGSFAMIFSRLDKRGKDDMEKAYNAAPPWVKDVTIKVLDVSEKLTEALSAFNKVGREVTDGKPNSDAPIYPPL